MVTPTVVETITAAVAGLGGQLLTVAAVGLGVGVSLLALRKGWTLVRGFIK